MSTKYKIGENEIPHFISFSVVHWIDALTRNEYKDILAGSLQYCRKEKGMKLHAWILMSNHVHLVLSCRQGFLIRDCLRDLKKYTSKQIVEAIKNNPKESRKEWMIWMFERAGKKNINNKGFQFWQQDNHPIAFVTNEMLQERLDYLHENPVKAGIVFKAEDYIYSSAIDYYTEQKGFIELDLLLLKL